MKKGIAIPYIIAIILGIAVIAIIGLVFFGVGGGLQGEVSSADCQRKLNVYCGIWLTQGYGYERDADGKETDKPLAVGYWNEYALGCSNLNPRDFGNIDDDRCNGILGRVATPEQVTTPTTPTRPTGTGQLGQPANADGTCDVGVPCDEDGRTICRVACA